jgi:hypothetical protein
MKMNPLPPLPPIALGHYRHYKGGDYEVLGVVRHSESCEPMVLYRPLYNPSGLWVRPYGMFIEQIEFDGRPQPRFALVSDASPASEPDGHFPAGDVFDTMVSRCSGLHVAR